MSPAGSRVVVVGGSSGIGLATAKAAAGVGAAVVVAGRSEERLREAVEGMGAAKERVEARAVDLTQKGDVEAFFAGLGEIDHLVLPGSSVTTGTLKELDLAEARASMDSKFWGPYVAVRHARVDEAGSVTLFSGALSRRPAPGTAALSAVNAAIEALGRALALELAPVRVNVVSPGLVDTPAYGGMPAEQREAMYRAAADRLPVGRVGAAEDAAATALYLMQNGFSTGAVVDVDGGGLIA